MEDLDLLKIIEVARPERMLDAKSKTAMLSVATWADYYRVGEAWYGLQSWRKWQHGKQVNEVSHYGEYATMQGDLLSVCPEESTQIICRVQVTEIRMVDCKTLTDAEVSELGYASRPEYDEQWAEMTDDSPRGWFMRVMLVPDGESLIQ